MNDDAELARILRRFLVSDEYWDCWKSDDLGKGELTLDGDIELSLDEAAAVEKYQIQADSTA